MATSKTKKKTTTRRKKPTTKKTTQARKTPAKPVSPDTPRYCLEIVDGKYCNGEVVKSGIVINKNSECYCTKCGRYYLKYTGRPIEPKTEDPTDRQIKAAEKRDAELQGEIERLKADGMTDAVLLRLQAHKNIAYSGRKETPTPVVLESKDAQVLSAVVAPELVGITDDDFSELDDLDSLDKLNVTDDLEGMGDFPDLDAISAPVLDELNIDDDLDMLGSFDTHIEDDGNKQEPIADNLNSLEDEINQALAELDDEFDDLSPTEGENNPSIADEFDDIQWDNLDDLDNVPQDTLVDEEELDTLFFPLENPEEPNIQALTQEEHKAKHGAGKSFFSKRNPADEEFPDIIEEVEFETVVLKEPEPFNQGISDDEVESMWTDALAKKHNLTVDQVKTLLSEESARLKVENYKLDGIDFNPKKLSDEAILAEIRDNSLTSL